MTTPTADALSQVTIDTSLLYPSTARRFLMTLWDMQALKIPVLPRTSRELHGVIKESESAYWKRRLKREATRTGMHWSPQIIIAIADAASEAAGQWVNQELGYGTNQPWNDSALQRIEMDPAAQLRADDIAEQIPKRCFQGRSLTGHRGDRSIIAEGVVCGFKVLATDNRTSIKRSKINEWLLEQTLTSEDFVLDGDEAIDRAGHGKTHPAQLLKTVLIAALPDTPAPKDRENTIVEQFIQRMHHDGLRTIAEDCHQEWTLHDTRQIYQEAREIIEGGKSIARHTEQRRVSATRLAAREAGYER